ncbi:bifunctional glycosyltransferase/CDP-glycerol:glycerophosphate glycerophosphotransferase [Marinitenerispora sediminis]|uniref:CDP-glycerol glycerophosphotransferase n=1 Tax=Marinitenerispora sediminis TaxID=1931232 RepID=A0A368T8Z6_9ACTN|nr:CDP-glycerol glycerophosphotransferase family protein [Marinitenerispora sediminis]RCV52716.1 CDP-glycerol glycerophosphotransferase [Marinitenerispora sediminis]RCV56065.1 CDP-glycerol glycerophosphotransferase [Marinitenerispora sediminis]RCV58999.1 CDP-glycerol glycerophosphotransferase [Marinitenerispora sediminis]
MPKLSLIVPFDVTEPRLRDCLDSLAGQSADLADAEIVLVPIEARTGPADPAEPRADGVAAADAAKDEGEDEDADGEPAARAATDADPDTDPDAAKDDGEEEDGESVGAARTEGLDVARDVAGTRIGGATVTLLTAAAGGDAAACRLGAGASSGEYLLFVRGDDALPGYAVRYLLDSLESSGSDFAAGNLYRFNELGSRPSSAHRRAFDRVRVGTHVRATPALLADRLLGNKLWRRTFWESLPPLRDEEDADLAVLRAHFAARAVDVLPAPVYLRRDREAVDDLSRIENMSRRVAAIADLSASLAGADRALWDDHALRRDLRRVLLRLDDADQAARERFLDLANAYLDTVDRAVLDGVGVLHRLNYHLVRKRRLDRLMEVITFQKSVELKKAPVVRRGLHYYIRYPFFEDPETGVPRELYRLDTELKVRQKTESVQWRDGRLVVGGRIGIRHLRAGRRWQQQLLAFAVNADTGRRVPVPVKVRLAAEYRLPDVPDAARHDYGGFEVSLDPAKLRMSGQWRATEWQLELVVVNRGLVRRRIVANPVSGPPERPPYHQVAEDVWVRPVWDDDQQLRIRVAPVRARVRGHRLDAAAPAPELEISGEFVAPPAAEARVLRLTRLPGTAVLERPLQTVGDRFSVRIPAAELLNHMVNEGNGALRQERWRAELRTPVGTAVPLVLPEDVEPAAHPAGDGYHEVVVQRTSDGHLRLRAGWAHPVIRAAEWAGAQGRELVLTGQYAADSQLRLVFKARGRDEEHVFDVTRDGDAFRAVFTPAAIRTLSGTLPLSAGSYQLWARVRHDGSEGTDVRAELDSAFVRSLPLEMETPERGYTFADSGFDTPVLRVGGDLRPDERGSFAQRRLREESYPAMREEELREEILFDSYTGRQFSDSPHSVYAELRARGGRWADYPMSWLVRDGQVNLPADLTRVRHNGRDFYESLARARYLVTNSRQPAWFTRRPDQTVVQTWHGSMLKRIGFDIENIRGKSRDYHEKLAWETRQWDYLVSPSPWATPILRRAFRFEGEILETGYPRNDIFFSAEREALAERTRRRLGLPEGRKVILYAPTWRDDKYYTRGKHKLDLHLDLRRMYDKLGDDHVLLVRRHPRVVDSVPIVGEDFVYDVSLYPEIMELFLITDILVTDYSSMMFDFANTGRPMLFFTYDIESYRDNLRGFYFDFEETAPGPLLLESDDVIASVLGIDEVAGSYADRYRAFVDQFCPLDDGRAAARVVDRVFGGG